LGNTIKVTVIKNLNVRTGKPAVDAPCFTYLLPGAVIEVDDTLIVGDLYECNDRWFKGLDGNFYWSGGILDKAENSDIAMVRIAISQNQALKMKNKAILEMTPGAMDSNDRRIITADIHLSSDIADLPTTISGLLPEGIKFQFPVRKIVHSKPASVSAAASGDKIYNNATPDYIGSLGCFIQDLDSQKIAALTCCHVITNGVYGGYKEPTSLNLTLNDLTTGQPIGNNCLALMNTQYDLAWIELANQSSQPVSSLNSVREINDNDIVCATPLKFFGATTPKGYGVVLNYGCTMPVVYDGTTINISGLILMGIIHPNGSTESSSDKGDSGALVFSNNNEPIGILVADGSEYTYVMPLNPFLASNNKIIY
jgi:hypothetical protein